MTLKKLVFLGGVSTATIATGSYFLATSLGSEGRTSTRSRRSLDELAENKTIGMNNKYGKPLRWTAIFKWETGKKVVCRERKETEKWDGEDQEWWKNRPSEDCTSEWAKGQKNEIEVNGGFKLKVQEKIVEESKHEGARNRTTIQEIEDIMKAEGESLEKEVGNGCNKEIEGSWIIYSCKNSSREDK